ncbi:major capsid protein [Achromobacter phage Mano]|uniref:Major capsid protein n=1 Tax=Achromobacter phage Mano TaxID=2767570 RepID=A0A7L8G8F9_9CAUD|nr:major head protein [Achromobacter phage Mano]QOE32738.1 major capsid protein [Achromobacter phage Mano]
MQRDGRDAALPLPSAAKRTADQVATRVSEMRERSDLRRASSEVGAVDKEARTVELSFSSEAEYRRWFGIEILSHAPGAMRVDRLNASAPYLWMHNWDDQRGVVLPNTVRIQDNKGRATVKFSRSEEGERLFQDVQDGITPNVSVGYRIHNAQLIEVRDDDTEVWLVTDWEPYEISSVSVPADITVGHGRSLEKPQEETTPAAPENTGHRNNADQAQQPKPEGKDMNEKIMRDAQGNLVRAEVDENGKYVRTLELLEKADEGVAQQLKRGGEAERKRVAAILDMGDRFKQPDLAREFARSEKSPEEFQAALLEEFNKRAAKPLSEQSRTAEIGMTDADLRRYSLFKAVRALTPGATQADREAAAFEFECSRAAEDKYEKQAKGILVPADVLGRAFNAGGAANTPAGATSGANVVATDLLAGSFIDMLRNRTTIMRLGTPLAGLVGNVDIPKQLGGATAYWVGEGEDAAEGTPVIGQITLNPKTVAAYTDITRRLLKQSTPDAEGIVRRDLLNAMAQAIDLAGYYGTGADDQPRGLKNYAGINAVDFAATYPTFGELVDMESEVSADNADIGSMAYVGNARFRGHCKKTARFGTGTESTIWEMGNTVNGYRTEITNQVANGDVFFGNFADLIIGLWGGLDLTVDPYSLSKSGGLRIVVFQDVDFALRRTESICYGSATVTP